LFMVSSFLQREDGREGDGSIEVGREGSRRRNYQLQ